MSAPGGEEQVFSSDEQDQQCIQLREKISTKQLEMVQIINNKDKFTNTITELANIAKLKIDLNQKQELKFAIVYLKEAEKILEYAASSGKNINKQLIITILHNQASIYQKLWELNNCSDYLQGIIFNYQNFIRQTSSQGSVLSKDQNQTSPDPTKLKMKQKLARYNLQYCAVNSQLSNHDSSIAAIKKAHKLLVQCITGNNEQFRAIFELIHKGQSQKSSLKIDLLQGLLSYDLKFQQKIDLSEVNKNLLKVTHFSLQIWDQNKNKKLEPSLASDSKVEKHLEQYSIGNIVEIVPIQLDKQEVGFLSMKQNKNKEFDSQYHPYNKIILLSACFFSRATELRLKSIQLFKKNLEERKFSRQFKLSINYHLLAVMIVATFIPCNVKYLKQILLSYQKHYGVNLLQYKTVQIESIVKMMDLLGIAITDYSKSTKINTQKADLEENDSKNDYNLKTNFEIHRIKKLQKMKSLKKITKQLNEPKKYQEKSIATPNKSKDSKNSFSFSKYDKKDRTHSKNDTLKRHAEYRQKQVKESKSPANGKAIPKIKSKKSNQMMKSRQREQKKSRHKEVVDETQQLFFCFTKKTKKTQGGFDSGSQLRSSSIASNSNSKSKINKKSILSPKNIKTKINSALNSNMNKSSSKRKTLGDHYYF